MKLTKITLIALFMASAVVSFAQLSDRQNNPGKFKIGTRPVAGNLGFMVGGSMGDLKAIFKGDSTKNTLPLLALKYYASDSKVWRIGVKINKKSTTRAGETDTSLTPLGISRRDSSSMSSEFLLYPGMEKHFLNSNILDAYVAVSLPIGFLRETESYNVDYVNATNDHYHHQMNKMSLAYGIEGFVGVQAFIADLPLALGLEMGVSGIGYRGEKYKNKDDITAAGVNTSQTYYTYKNDPLSVHYSKLKSNSYEMKSVIRLTISYYFAK
ncbi:MAG: hypothetical protein HY063_12755 [Bacteroidetes bacterium]|nr:hypothetical protein [Bacteroidota bacterium]